MLGKHYSLGSVFEETGEARVKLANFDDLKSQGEDIASFLNTFKPDPGFVYLHVIAMGAGEYYGCNINGDYFPERDLINRHNTFVTNAKVFKEHDNKPYSPDYGHVAFSWYNPKMHRVELILAVDKVKGKEFIERQARGEQLEVSMGCFPAGTLVTRGDGVKVVIEMLTTGDTIRSATGEIRKINTCITYPYTGNLYTIKVCGDVIQATHNHPFLVADLSDYESLNIGWVDAENLKAGMHLVHIKDNKAVQLFIIESVTSEPVENLPVYNFSVDVDESYCVGQYALGVHNCKVAYDVCSICGNKAKRRDEYCAHIRHDKKKIYPDGKQPYMINYNPTFFDISIVKRRADRIAYVLDKVASVNSGDSTISYHKYNEFENLDQSVIPFAPDPERAVFDWEDEPVEKAAGVPEPTLGEKIAMIKRINSDAVRVLNKGIMKSLPALEAEEPDLPPAMLDRIAAKYSIPDILKSFIISAVPLKPREFTRIIIVNQGLPLESYDSVLRGVLRAKATELPAASSQNEITSLLEPFLTSRSSFLPAILARIEKLLQRKEKTAGIKLDPMSSYYGLNPNITFGHISQQPAYNTIEATVPNRAYVIQKNPMASMPIVVSPEAYARSLNRPKLRLPDLDPEKTGLILGGMYLASRAMPNIAEIMKQYPELPIAAAIASLYYAKSKMDEPDVMQKKAMIIQPTPELVGKYALPFVATHLASAHLRGVHENGGKLSDTEKFIAEHPDILSILAPLAIGLALKKHANVKLASSRSLNYQADESDEKVAYLADILADAAML